MTKKDISSAIGNIDTDRTEYETTLILSALLNYCQELEQRLAKMEARAPVADVPSPCGWFWESEFGILEFRERMSEQERVKLKAFPSYTLTERARGKA